MNVPNTTSISTPVTPSNVPLDNLVSSQSARVLGSLTLSLALIVGLPGNAFVVWTIMGRMRQRPVTSILILNLAVADGVTLLTAPFWIHFLVSRDWAFGLVACKAFHYICCLNMYASIFLIASMSVDRFLAVTRPFAAARLRGRKRWVLGLLVALWSLAALAAVPAAYYREVRVGLIDSCTLCEPEHPASRDTAFHYLTETGLGFVVPLGVLCISYAVVGRRVRALRAGAGRKGRTSRLITVLVTVFAILWAPYHVVNLAQVGAELSGHGRLEGLLKEARPVVTSLAFVSCGVNPLLYAFSGIELLRTSGTNFMAKLFEATAVPEAGPRRGTGAETSLGQVGLRVGLNQVNGGSKTLV